MRPANNVRRPRGRPNRKQHGSPRNQTFDSHGPDVRVRGNATQIYDKYVSLARDATSAGDRVAAEGYFQFAEHYFRIINDSTDPRRANPQQNRPDQIQGGQDQVRTDRDQPRTGDSQSAAAGEQPPLEMEQPFIDQGQAQGVWPPRVDGSSNAGSATESDGEASRDENAREINGDPAASAEPVSEESSVASEEDAPARPRRSARGRPRGRRNSANGAGKAGDDSTQEAEDSESPKDDSESEELAT